MVSLERSLLLRNIVLQYSKLGRDSFLSRRVGDGRLDSSEKNKQEHERILEDREWVEKFHCQHHVDPIVPSLEHGWRYRNTG